MGFTFGDWAYGLTLDDYTAVSDLLPEDVLGNLQVYTGPEGTFYIYQGDEDELSDALEELGEDARFSTFRYCGSAHGFGYIG